MRLLIHDILHDDGQGDQYGHKFAFFMMLLIMISILIVVLDSVQELHKIFGQLFFGLEIGITAIFAIEYFLRLWTCTISPDFSSPIIGRLRYALTPLMIIDFLVILPLFLNAQNEMPLLIFRSFRIIRFLRIFKLVRYSDSLQLIIKIVSKKKHELQLTIVLNLTLILISSTLLFMVENECQPKVFSSIPASMWWAIITLSTIGYGDIYPVTVIGKILAGTLALIGVAMFGLPTAILASGFIEESSKVCSKCLNPVIDLKDDEQNNSQC